MRPSTSATICGDAKFSSISRYTALVMVLLWKKNASAIQSDVMLHYTLTLGLSQTCSIRACGFSLPQILHLWQFKISCVENGLVRENNFLEINVSSSDQF
jgi:hypothetical protein